MNLSLEFQLAVLFALAVAGINFLTLCLKLRTPRNAGVPACDFMDTVRTRGLEQSLGAALITDSRLRDREILYVNPAFSALTGFDAEEVVGCNGDMLSTNGPLRMESVLWLDARADGRDVHWIAQLHRRDGTTFWAEADLSPVHRANGAIAHYLVELNDITASFVGTRVQVTAARGPALPEPSVQVRSA